MDLCSAPCRQVRQAPPTRRLIVKARLTRGDVARIHPAEPRHFGLPLAMLPITVGNAEEEESDLMDRQLPSGLSRTKESCFRIPAIVILCDCCGCVQEYHSRSHPPTANALVGSLAIRNHCKSTSGAPGSSWPAPMVLAPMRFWLRRVSPRPVSGVGRSVSWSRVLTGFCMTRHARPARSRPAGPLLQPIGSKRSSL